ncbi:MAG: lectin-like protein, partial [Chloroflexota bacterium]
MQSVQRIVAVVTAMLVAVTMSAAPAPTLATSPTITDPGTRILSSFSTAVQVWPTENTPLTGLSGSVKVVASCGAADPDCTLAISVTTGLTAAVGYSSSDWLTGAPELGFVGTRAAVNAALATMTVALSAAKTTTVTVDATASNVAALTLGDGTHYYEFVTADGNVGWLEARTNALTHTLNGLNGYLASVTSQAESDFVASRVGDVEAWLGGNDIDTEGTWVWADAPETDPFFISGPCVTGLQGMCNLSGVDHFNFWSAGEPNNTGSNEDALQVLSGGSGRWNDIKADGTGIWTLPYVVEYSGGPAGGGVDTASRTFTVALTASPTITDPGTRHLPTLSTPVKVWLNDTTPLAGLSGTIKIVASCGAGDPDCTLAISVITDLSAAVGYNSSDWLTGAPELGFVGTRAAV